MRRRVPHIVRLAALGCLSLWSALPSLGQFGDFGDSRDVVRVTVYPARNTVEPGGNLRIAIIIDHQPKWHTHTNDPIVPPELGDPEDYIKTAINVQTPAGSPLLAHPELIKWPQPHMTTVNFLSEPVEYGVFSQRAIAYLPVVVRRDAKPGAASLTVKATYQACDDKVCLAPVRDQSFVITINIVAPGQADPPPETDIDRAIFADFPEHVFAGLDRGPEPDDASASTAYSIGYVIGGIISAVVGIVGVFVLVKILRR